MAKNLYISDTHFGHDNVITFDGRPFKSIEEMDQKIIENWNDRTEKNDSVYILGDFCWKKEPVWLSILDQLNGSKFLIKGNHDNLNMSATLKSKFAWIGDYREVKDSGFRLCLSHFPMPFYKRNMDPDVYMLYGHVHNSFEHDLLFQVIDYIKNKDARGFRSSNKCQMINVGCMMPWMDYGPRTIQEIIGGFDDFKKRNGMA